MEYQKIINLLHNTPNQPSKFETKNCVKINDESHGKYNEDNQIRFKTSMLRSNLCDYNDGYILVKGTITDAPEIAVASNNAYKKIIFKNCPPFTNCISKINNTQVGDAHDVDVVMSLYNLIEYSDNYSKTPGVLWQAYRDLPALDDNGATIDFNAANDTGRWFNLNVKSTGKTNGNSRKDVEIMVS